MTISPVTNRMTSPEIDREQIEQMIDPDRIIGGLRGELAERHDAALRRSRLVMAKMPPAIANSVAPAAISSMVVMRSV